MKVVKRLKKNFRYYMAMLVGKLSHFALGLLGKNVFYPGKFVYQICPDFLGMIELPKTIIAVTGTNGKTTVTNLLADCFTQLGYNFCSNVAGSNKVAATISLLLGCTSWSGKAKCDFALLEVDEKSTDKIFKYVKPQYLVVTNLYRDSYKNNGHVDFIADFLNRFIPDTTTLLLNADDLESSGLKPDNPRHYYAVDPLPGEREERRSTVQDGRNCPVCDYKLIQDYIRYHHIGRYHCEHCGFSSPEPEYRAVSADFAAGTMSVGYGGEVSDFRFAVNNDTDVYNALAAISLLAQLGIERSRIRELLGGLAVTKSRFNRSIVGDFTLTLMMAKGSNPIATSRVFDYIRKQEGPMGLIIMNHEVEPQERNVVMTAWYYDTDFQYLAVDRVSQIVAVGKQNQDLKAALLFGGVPEDRIMLCRKIAESPELLDLSRVRHVYVLYDTETTAQAAALQAPITARMQRYLAEGKTVAAAGEIEHVD